MPRHGGVQWVVGVRCRLRRAVKLAGRSSQAARAGCWNHATVRYRLVLYKERPAASSPRPAEPGIGGYGRPSPREDTVSGAPDTMALYAIGRPAHSQRSMQLSSSSMSMGLVM